jgi:GT2 family glycosyltransferase
MGKSKEYTTIVSIVIVNYNGKEFLKDCLESIYGQSYHNFELILVDNGSTDDSVQFVRESFPEAIIIENKKNLGFAKANNQGIKISKGKYIALLNNDTVVDKDWLKNLTKVAESSSNPPLPPFAKGGMGGFSDKIISGKVGMWAGKILSLENPHIIDSVGGLMISNDGIAKGRGRLERDIGQYDREEEVFIPSACAALYRKRMFDEVGLFDEDFFAYCEDTDLGLRARLAGWKTISAPKAVVYHHYSGTTGKYTSIKAYLVERNHIWLAIKNFPLSKLLFLPLYTFWRYLMQVYGIFRKKGAGGRFLEDFSGSKLFIILLKALWGAIKGMPVILKKRRYIQGKRIVTDKEINGLFKRYGITIKDLVFKD